MNRLKRNRLAWVAVALLLILFFTTPSTALADSWSMPTTKESLCSNGAFVVVVEPGSFSKKKKALATVYEIKNDQPREFRWKTTLENERAPLSTFLTDDGQHIITLDNHAHVGYDNVLSFYNPQGHVKSYTLEALAADFLQEKNLKNFRSVFMHSVSSRWWRAASMTQISNTDQPPRFALWLHWAKRWYVWNYQTGLPINRNAQENEKWNIDHLGIQSALALLEGDNVIPKRTACIYLSQFKDPQYKPHLEKLLSSEKKSPFSSYYPARHFADSAIAVIDGLCSWDDFAKNIRSGYSTPKFETVQYYYLAKLKINVTLPRETQPGRSGLVALVYRQDVSTNEWLTKKPDYIVQGGFSDKRTHTHSIYDLKLQGIKPGRYWIKVVWDKLPHHINRSLWDKKPADKQAPAARAVALTPGDHVNTRYDIIHIQAGQGYEIPIQCDQQFTPLN